MYFIWWFLCKNIKILFLYLMFWDRHFDFFVFLQAWCFFQLHTHKHPLYANSPFSWEVMVKRIWQEDKSVERVVLKVTICFKCSGHSNIYSICIYIYSKDSVWTMCLYIYTQLTLEQHGFSGTGSLYSWKSKYNVWSPLPI